MKWFLKSKDNSCVFKLSEAEHNSPSDFFLSEAVSGWPQLNGALSVRMRPVSEQSLLCFQSRPGY